MHAFFIALGYILMDKDNKMLKKKRGRIHLDSFSFSFLNTFKFMWILIPFIKISFGFKKN